MALATKVKKYVGVNVKLNVFPGLNQLYVYQNWMERKGVEEHQNFRKTYSGLALITKLLI